MKLNVPLGGGKSSNQNNFKFMKESSVHWNYEWAIESLTHMIRSKTVNRWRTKPRCVLLGNATILLFGTIFCWQN